MTAEDLDKPVASRLLAEWLGITTQAVTKHTREGVLAKGARGYDLRASVRAYCEHMRTMAAGRGGSETVNLTAERARLARVQADQYALKNAALRGELVEVVEAERAWSDTLRQVRSCILAVPSRVRQRLGHLTPADIAVIDGEVRDALTRAGNEI